jgi:hypothetical protein
MPTLFKAYIVRHHPDRLLRGLTAQPRTRGRLTYGHYGLSCEPFQPRQTPYGRPLAVKTHFQPRGRSMRWVAVSNFLKILDP